MLRVSSYFAGVKAALCNSQMNRNRVQMNEGIESEKESYPETRTSLQNVEVNRGGDLNLKVYRQALNGGRHGA